jgi:hypothetical protein
MKWIKLNSTTCFHTTHFCNPLHKILSFNRLWSSYLYLWWVYSPDSGSWKCEPLHTSGLVTYKGHSWERGESIWKLKIGSLWKLEVHNFGSQSCINSKKTWGFPSQFIKSTKVFKGHTTRASLSLICPHSHGILVSIHMEGNHGRLLLNFQTANQGTCNNLN